MIELLSEYQDRMIKPIFKNSGTVDKFIGDAVMATFGTPVSQGNYVQNALTPENANINETMGKRKS